MGDGERLGLRVLLSGERERDLDGERLELQDPGWGPGLRDELFPSGPPRLLWAPGDGEVLVGRARGGRSFALEEGAWARAQGCGPVGWGSVAGCRAGRDEGCVWVAVGIREASTEEMRRQREKLGSPCGATNKEDSLGGDGGCMWDVERETPCGVITEGLYVG